MASSVSKNIFLFSISLLFFTKIIESISIEHQNCETEICSRHKREGTETPEKIKIHVKDGTDTKIFEVSKLENNHIANENLQLYTIHTASGTESYASQKKNQGGECFRLTKNWVMYQNRENISAVTYFPELQLLSGIVGKNYHISFSFYNGSGDFHFEVNSDNRSAGRKKREINDNFEQFLNSSYIKNKFKRSIEDNSNKPIPSFYLESLVFISGQKIDSLPSGFSGVGDQSCEHYKMHVLSFFNIIDMLFTTTYFKINLVGIFIRRDGEELPPLNSFSSVKSVSLEVANRAILDTMKHENTRLNLISSDYVIYLTDLSLTTNGATELMNNSLTYPKRGIYQTKKEHPLDSYPIIITQSDLTLISIKSAALKIFEMIGGLNYVKNNNVSTDNNFIIIDDFNKKCPLDKCFKWNEDYCIYVNQPASLKKLPSILTTINDQCWCRNNDYYYEQKTNETIENICTNGFECKSKNAKNVSVTLVASGTPCGDNHVCWDNNQCKQMNE